MTAIRKRRSAFFSPRPSFASRRIHTAFKGVIDWGSGGLDLSGEIRPGNADTPVAFAIVGLGRPGSQTDGWEYDYNGCLAYKWPAGNNQVPALVGSLIRAKPHRPATPRHSSPCARRKHGGTRQ
ncbi:hypothetical protein AB7008_08540 [Bradyrhizobium sp. 521_C7_N1_3]|uniref:hypothetical protein n=1 Tax=Bradyrhizobium sp. 521_C7_N1_3 TaxID=3240368 RepID=UPI003F89F2B9